MTRAMGWSWWWIVACTDQGTPDVEDPRTPSAPRLPDGEQEARDLHAATPIRARGRVVTLQGAPIAMARVDVGGSTTHTDAEGWWVIDNLTRHNVLVRVSADGHQTEGVLAILNQPVSTAEVLLDDVRLVSADLVRFVFAGDTALGRRYLDPFERTARDLLPPDEPDALIQVSDPLPGSRAVFDGVRDWLSDAEVLALNLECAVTDRPHTPHPTKDYVIFTLPGSLPAIIELGTDWISLGNNHVYDFLEAGVTDTLRAVAATGVPSGGLGHSPEEAFAPSSLTAGGARWRMVAASSVTGSQHPIDYQADSTSGGAANLEDDERVRQAITTARAEGEVPIAFLHTGAEYTESPTDPTLARFDRVAEDGAAFIVATHPHTAQGFGWHHGALAAWSLGNFAFDQDRLETYQSVVLLADLTPDGEPVSVRAAPLYVEDYVPRLLGGELADLLVLRMARESTATVIPEHGARVVLDDRVTWQTRTVELTTEIGPDGYGLLDLRAVADRREWLSGLTLPAEVRAAPGHDRLGFGDFEDLDLDGDVLETSRWYLGGDSKMVCLTGAARGVAGLCSHRSSLHDEDSMWNFRERVRVAGDALAVPRKDQWLVATVRSDGGGALDVELDFQASEGEARFGQQVVRLVEAGWTPWTTVGVPIDMPPDGADPADPTANARAVRLSFHHHPPPSDEGWVFVDDVAVVSWGDLLDDGEETGVGPTRFLRLQGPPGEVTVGVQLRRGVIGAE